MGIDIGIQVAHIIVLNWNALNRKTMRLGYLKDILPAKILSPFLPTTPLQYIPKIRFIQATIDCPATNKTKNALHKEMVILNHIGGEQISKCTVKVLFC